jgi:serine/threonine protein kinase
LKALHDKGYLHGDIRTVNLVVAKNDEAKFRLIDFDWAGKEMNVYTGSGLWYPADVYDRNPITTMHHE